MKKQVNPQIDGRFAENRRSICVKLTFDERYSKYLSCILTIWMLNNHLIQLKYLSDHLIEKYGISAFQRRINCPHTTPGCFSRS